LAISTLDRSIVDLKWPRVPRQPDEQKVPLDSASPGAAIINGDAT